MKKIIAFVLVFVMIFALCACGEEKVPEAEPAAETAAPAAEPSAEPEAEPAQEEKGEPVEIEITTENFNDYFELRKTIDYDSAEKDADGNYINLVVYYDYVLKEGIELVMDRARDCIVAADFDVEYTQILNPEDVDFDTLTHGEGEAEDTVSFATSIDGAWWNADRTPCEAGADVENAEYMLTVLSLDFFISNDNGVFVNDLSYFEVTSASGTIVIYK